MALSGPITLPPPLGLPPSVGMLDQVSDTQLARYAELIHLRTGIRVLPHKKVLLSNRLRRRLRATGVKDFEEYYHCLKRLPPEDPEWDAFLQEITTHETYLFRDQAQWDWFRSVYLPERSAAARKRGGPAGLRIWSAACSTGDEAVTAACCIAACLPDFRRWQIRILGTDIGMGAVEQAATAAFGQRAMHLVPEDYCRRFFTKAKDGEVWHARPMITDLLTFRPHNLMEPLPERPFDLVWLKNVLIYFSPLSKRTVLHNVRAALKPGGLLIVGAAEGVADLLRDFHRHEPWLYRKPVS
jgi:chemotaxis protein methyltransferase CheR